MRVLAALVALTAVLLTGCSRLPASPTDQIRGALVTTRLAGTAQVDVASRTAILGQTVDITGGGAIDMAQQSADLTLQVPMLGGALHTIIAGGMVYAQLPPMFAAFVPGAKPWASVSLDRLTQQQFGTSLAQLGIGPSGDPLTQLGYLQGIGDGHEIGPEQIDGTPTTHIAATIDLRRTPAAQDPATKGAVDRLVAQIGSPTVPVDVWIADDGRLRRVAQIIHGTPVPGAPPTDQTTTITFTKFGVPAPPGPPPPEDTTDLSALLPG